MPASRDRRVTDPTGAREKDCQSWPGAKTETLRSSEARRAFSMSASRLFLVPQPRVQGIAQTVAQEVDAQNGE